MREEDLKQELKELIIRECDKEFNPSDISDDEELFGSNAKLDLDSMDALQISMELHKQYGIKITNSKELRKIMLCINTLAKYIQTK